MIFFIYFAFIYQNDYFYKWKRIIKNKKNLKELDILSILFIMLGITYI